MVTAGEQVGDDAADLVAGLLVLFEDYRDGGPGGEGGVGGDAGVIAAVVASEGWGAASTSASTAAGRGSARGSARVTLATGWRIVGVALAALHCGGFDPRGYMGFL